ncbi:HypC/HybG/HupF family hydrogenase formation chaperone [Zoogloea oleivorans]|uniref:HypC/HybG/HupF family hydrogenase formation chaperone n=1 Tax=Zoogloea oleivorans TaxID=1552750 RepID=A0A6C2CRT7_9RHOO|nr:HypC/HybG/HupF family hydrogenase formation chaperone [Zoogloea sp.]TYC55945.1 HypC/HybG/HupF family hydrogenase formation chaperone [Zoogloea oleivorans]
MCLGVPYRVMESTAWIARCEGPDGELLIDLSLVGEQPVGTWLLTFLGAAREVIDAARATAINNALAALDAAMLGDTARIDALFADLVDREPALPDHLKDLQ